MKLTLQVFQNMCYHYVYYNIPEEFNDFVKGIMIIHSLENPGVCIADPENLAEKFIH